MLCKRHSWVTRLNHRRKYSAFSYRNLLYQRSTEGSVIRSSFPRRSTFNRVHSTMPTELPFDIIALIIDIVGESKDTDLLKELALVSHSFHQICSNHLFAIIELHSAQANPLCPSSKKGFVKLLKSRPDVVKYIRKLKYIVIYNEDDDHLLSCTLLNFLPAFSRLDSFTIIAAGSHRDWNRLNPSLTSAFLYLMHLPTINHIDLSYHLQKPNL